MELTVVIKGKPVSINQAHYRNKVLTAKARAYREVVWKSMLGMQNQVEAFRAAFNPQLHGLEVSVTVYTPVKKYYLKGDRTNGISAQKFDLGNLLKLLDDFVLNERYNGRGAPVIGVDDKFILSYSNLKALPHRSDEWVVHYTVKIINTPALVIAP